MAQGFEIREVMEPSERSALCERVLRALPEWFGIEESLVGYVRQVAGLTTFAACAGEEAAGFLSLLRHTECAQEICVMGVLREYHRTGAGRALVAAAAQRARREGATFLTVKTVAETSPDEGYARTRAFYRAVGFLPVEVFPDLWDEQNPCLLSVMIL